MLSTNSETVYLEWFEYNTKPSGMVRKNAKPQKFIPFLDFWLK